jgi:hypothetical protein
MSLDPAARDARLPAAVQGVVPRGETCWLCDHPRALPAAGSACADWVVLPLAFAWLYPDSMLVLEALEFARLGLILHGEWGAGGPDLTLQRLTRILSSLHLTTELATSSSPTTVVIARRITASS